MFHTAKGTLILQYFFLGDSILVHPVSRSGATDAKVYFPGEDTLWYEIENYKVYQAPGYQTIPVGIEKVLS